MKFVSTPIYSHHCTAERDAQDAERALGESSSSPVMAEGQRLRVARSQGSLEPWKVIRGGTPFAVSQGGVYAATYLQSPHPSADSCSSDSLFPQRGVTPRQVASPHAVIGNINLISPLAARIDPTAYDDL